MYSSPFSFYSTTDVNPYSDEFYFVNIYLKFRLFRKHVHPKTGHTVDKVRRDTGG